MIKKNDSPPDVEALIYYCKTKGINLSKFLAIRMLIEPHNSLEINGLEVENGDHENEQKCMYWDNKSLYIKKFFFVFHYKKRINLNEAKKYFCGNNIF